MSIYTKDMPNIINDPDIEVGEFSYGPLNIAKAYSGCKLKIGNFCSFGQGITIAFWGRHQMGDVSTYPFAHLHGKGWPPVSCTPVDGEDVYIGNDVWIGHNAIIMQGAEISDGAVIGANSIVGGYIEPYSVAVGNPAKEIKKRFNDARINALLTIKWWNWPIEKIKEHLQVISSPDISQLYNIWESEIK